MASLYDCYYYYFLIYALICRPIEIAGQRCNQTQIVSPRGRLVNPRCMKTGYFEDLQCFGRPTSCWCVDPFTGESIAETIRELPALPRCSDCITKLSNVLRQHERNGKFMPKCSETGAYAPLQCQGSVSNCWCVDPVNGKRISTDQSQSGTLICQPISLPSQSKHSPCQIRRDQNTDLAGAFLPNCVASSADLYELMQCHGSWCFCVDPATGDEAEDTRISAVEARIAPCRACHQKKLELLKKKVSDERLPNCLPNGNFDPTDARHCSPINATYIECFCIDSNGEETSGTRRLLAADDEIPICIVGNTTIDSNPSTSGPCLAMVNGNLRPIDQQPLCTSGGFFELLQCDSSECYCVDVVSGVEYRNTRAERGVQLPKCTPCSTEKFQIYRNGQPPPGTQLPRCQSEGHYELRQCSGSTGYCWCVDEKSGEEVENSKTGPGEKPIDCNRIEPSVDANPSSISKSFASTIQSIARIPPASKLCALEKDSGRECGENATINWYFVPDSYECVAFRFNGCAGNANRFETIGECWSKCKLPDAGICAGHVNPLSDRESDKMLTCQRANECPIGSICRMGAFFGACCEKENEELFARNYRPQCDQSNFQPVTIHAGGFELNLLGRNCGDNFCPEDSLCVQLEIFAHCCRKNDAVFSDFPPQSDMISVQFERDTRKFSEAPMDLVNKPRHYQCFQEKLKTCQQGEIGWYLDKSIGACVAARFCSNVSGYFKSLVECESRCYPQDGSACLAHRLVFLNPVEIEPNQSSSIICQNDAECPSGSVCKFGPFFGSCCNAKEEEIWERNWQPNCSNENSVYMIAIPERDNFRQPLLGASCSDYFCPELAECIQQEYFAHCCGQFDEPTPAELSRSPAPIIVEQELMEDDAKSPKNERIQEKRCFQSKPIAIECDAEAAVKNLNQRFYWNGDRGACMVFVSNECENDNDSLNSFQSKSECLQSCLPVDPPLCSDGFSTNGGHFKQLQLNHNQPDCRLEGCTDGFVCSTHPYIKRNVCCNRTIEEMYNVAYAAFCPNGGLSGGESIDDYYEVTFGNNCQDLICNENQDCVQVNAYFAKCCDQEVIQQNKLRFYSTEAPLIDDTRGFVCNAEKDSGWKCAADGKILRGQYFYYDADWKACFAFEYEGCGGNLNRFKSRSDCEQFCKPADGSSCAGPSSMSANPKELTGPDCARLQCPAGFACHLGFAFAECCNQTVQELVESAYSSQCPDGRPAGGVRLDYFLATFAKSCDDLQCQPGLECVQISSFFAKCCGYRIFPIFQLKRENCTRAQTNSIRECLLPLNNNATELSARNILPSANKIMELNATCAKFSAYQQCAKLQRNQSGYCYLFENEATANIVGFLCNEQSRILLNEHGDCIAQVSDTPQGRICERQFEAAIKNRNVFDVFCTALDKGLSCTQPHLVSKCGTEAANFLTQLADITKRNLFADCKSIVEESTTTTTIATSTVETTSTLKFEINEIRDCKKRRDLLSLNAQPGQYVPQCKNDGLYTPIQCHGSSGQCWCVDMVTGEEMNGTRSVDPGEKPFCGVCHEARSNAIVTNSSILPQCLEDGSYLVIQCDSSNGFCWCVDGDTGRELNGSRVGPRQQLPTCGLEKMLTCEQLPWKPICQPGNTQPQAVYRYFLEDNECKAYRFSYCAREAHVPPFALKTKSECEEFCLKRRQSHIKHIT